MQSQQDWGQKKFVKFEMKKRGGGDEEENKQ